MECFVIFEEASWNSYFERLTGFEEVALQFAQKLMQDYSKVGGMRIELFEQIIAEVTGLPRTRKSWFGWTVHVLSAKEYFLAAGEFVRPRGQGNALEYFPCV